VRISADLNTKYGIIETLKRKHLNAMPGEEKSPYRQKCTGTDNAPAALFFRF
jgi:hypothetical protein